MNLKAFTFILIFLSLRINAYEKSDAFIIRIYDDRVKVVAPQIYDPSLNVIVQNKTMVKIVAKLMGESGHNYSFFSISPGKVQSQRLKDFQKESMYFVPLSPSLQKVHLKLGSKPYEIP